MRPNWYQVYDGAVHEYDRDDELVLVTRETARLALSALSKVAEDETYHNSLAAKMELSGVVKKPSPLLWTMWTAAEEMTFEALGPRATLSVFDGGVGYAVKVGEWFKPGTKNALEDPEGAGKEILEWLR